MENIEQYDIAALMELYMRESKEFSNALQSGASWRELRDKRLAVQAISIQINRKYKELQQSGADRRRDAGPPHHI